MDKTKENNKGLTMISLVVVVIMLLLIAVITITTIRQQKIMPRTKNAQNEYNEMVANKFEEMDGDRVLNMLDLDE